MVSASAGAQGSSSDSQNWSFTFVRDLATELSAGRVELPSFPEAAARVQQVLSDESVTSERIARVISADAGLAARVLTMANSTLLHRGGTAVTDLKAAITRIGYDHIRVAALSYANGQLRRAAALAPIRAELEICWQEGIRVAALAHAMAKESRCVRTDEAMLAGLLHNIGKVYIIARSHQGSERGAGSHRVDEAVVQHWYPSVGQALIENWKLPDEIAAAVSGQLELDRHHEGPPDLQDLLIVATHVAAQMANNCADDSALAKMPPAIALGLTDSAFVRIVLESQTELEMLQAALG
ncbi:MAG: HDOD domain-containing protein [Steroidobacteraceae bacterium]